MISLTYDLLVLSGFPRTLLLRVLILPEVHDATDGRHGRWRDLDEIEAFLLRNRESLGRRHDAQLLARVIDDADFTNANALVDTRTVVSSG